MDTFGLDTALVAYHRAPNGMLLPAPGGMFGAGISNPVYRGGQEPAGDAGEGLDVPNRLILGSRETHGATYTPLPGILPPAEHLDYVQKFSAAGLLGIGLVLLVVISIVNPGRAFGLLGRGAARQAGVA